MSYFKLDSIENAIISTMEASGNEEVKAALRLIQKKVRSYRPCILGCTESNVRDVNACSELLEQFGKNTLTELFESIDKESDFFREHFTTFTECGGIGWEIDSYVANLTHDISVWLVEAGVEFRRNGEVITEGQVITGDCGYTRTMELYEKATLQEEADIKLVLGKKVA